ncbi:MAG: trigger factor [Longibaculum muris]|uniref:Trigger factor n=1 Tax=Longibaculum muris TaxID=1796628 RepID=A0A4R3Z3J1_9FIRM|nr:trigger factor [Longibaculum muris]KXU52498.1 trigger factor [Candidatus Stoquefichus sp. KLE1796]MBS5368630.1 trigger factor [Coprobacillus cateniformis]MCR1888578.1 trigger factor [Longibaculum muris]MED9810705.1 trigger factor [Longibaculum muris]TCV98433.1 trigger factor [Longibaculum muris]
METVCNKLENCMVEVKVTFTTEEWKDAQDKALNKLAKNVKIDGFRQGKAPAKLVKARVGKGAILEEATDIILQKNYAGILLDNDVHPVGQPEVKIDELTEETLKVTVNAPVAPEVTLGQYKGLEVKKGQVKVTKKEIEAELKNYQNQFAELVIKEEGTVENGDTAVIDFEGFKDGEAFEGGKGENYPLEIGSGSFIPGFEEQLVGMGIDEEKEINVTFPENYQAAELAGQAVVFKVKVHEIKSKVLPEIDDELAKDVNIDGIETLADLETYTKEQIKNRKQSEVESKFSDDIFNAVIENTPLEVPEVMVETEVQQMLREVEQNLSQQGLNMELFQQLTGKTMDDMKAEMREQAEKRVKFNLILAEIVKAENIEVSEEEVDEEIKEIATYYSREFDEVKKLFESQLGQIKSDLATRKAVQLIKDNVK